MAGVVVFGIQIGTHDEWKQDWCLIVCVIGGALGLVAFIILLIATINKPEFAPEKYFSSGFYVEQDRNQLYVVETDAEPVKVVYQTASEIGAPSMRPPAPVPALAPAPQAMVVSPGQVNPALEPDD